MKDSLPIRTRRLRLRLVKASDTEFLWPYTSDPETGKYMSWDAHTTPAETKRLLQRLCENAKNGTGYTWAIFLHDRFCGIISIISILRAHRSLRYDRGELAYWLGRPFRRQGIMSEAGEAVIAFAFKKLGLRKLVVGHVTRNKASEALIHKLGFRCVGIQRKEFTKHGTMFDVRTYELLRTEGRKPRRQSA